MYFYILSFFAHQINGSSPHKVAKDVNLKQFFSTKYPLTEEREIFVFLRNAFMTFSVLFFRTFYLVTYTSFDLMAAGVLNSQNFSFTAIRKVLADVKQNKDVIVCHLVAQHL